MNFKKNLLGFFINISKKLKKKKKKKKKKIKN
jgi:hypothetical protein